MSVATPPKFEEPVFTAADYDLPLPKLDGHRATQLELRFSGSGRLDYSSADDLALLEAARLGNEVRLIVSGQAASKSFRLKDGELFFALSVKVLRVEAGEAA
jgi:hypothetical protein